MYLFIYFVKCESEWFVLLWFTAVSYQEEGTNIAKDVRNRSLTGNYNIINYITSP
jgi:hypothetical protein